MIKKCITFVLIYILSLPCFVFAQMSDYYNADYVYKDKISPVKNQGKYGNCWSYAAIGALENSLVVQNGMDFSQNGIYSPSHMSAAMNTTNSKAFKGYTRSNDSGGNRASAVAYFARSAAGGVVRESEYPESLYRAYLVNKRNYEFLGLSGKVKHLTRAYFITGENEGSSSLGFELNENGEAEKITYTKNEEVIEDIKKAVTEYGGVAVSYYSYEKQEDMYYNPENSAYCVPWEDYITGKTPDGNSVLFTTDGIDFKYGTNHAVVIVGWDDNYSYENFKKYPVSFDGKKKQFENGAWIVKGSWGDGFGDGGYEYISYMEPTIGQYATVYEARDGNWETLSHSPKGLMESVRFPNTKYGIITSDRYEGKKIVVDGIGLYVVDDNITVDIVIDTNPSDELRNFTNEEFEKEKVSIRDMETNEICDGITFDKKGYYVLKFKEKVNAEKFDLYVRYTVEERRDVILPAGRELESEQVFKEDVTHWTYIDNTRKVHEWRDIDTNWAVDVLYTDGVRKICDVGTNGKMLNVQRYDEDEHVLFAAYLKDGTVIKQERVVLEFDSFGYASYETDELIRADEVKSIVI